MRARRSSFFLLITAALAGRSMLAAAEMPSAAFNLPGQARTRNCVGLKADKIPLRFADGTPTGWFVQADDPSNLGANHQPCPEGTIELDVHEITTSGSGMKLYFHPGGGSSLYRLSVEDGQYGHVAVEDLKAPPEPLGDINGKSAPLAGVCYFITPTRIPYDMWYKPNVSDGQSGSRYYTYGNPGFDKTGGRGDWTYINWSWVQNGGAEYPKNKCAGGGMVRALGKRDMLFEACSVQAIIGYSYGANNQINGRVTAFYGRIFAGPGEQGSEIHGWMPHSYQKSDGPIVPCVRRAVVKVLNPDPEFPAKDRSERMAWNLLHPARPDYDKRQQLLRRYRRESESMARMELLTELARSDDSETVQAFLALLREEKDSRVREQTILLLGFLASTVGQIKLVSAALAENYGQGNDTEKIRTLDVLSNIPAPEVARFVISAYRTAKNDKELSASADALLKLAPRLTMDKSLVKAAQKVHSLPGKGISDLE